MIFYYTTFELSGADLDAPRKINKRFRVNSLRAAMERASEYASGYSDGAAAGGRIFNMELVGIERFFEDGARS